MSEEPCRHGLEPGTCSICKDAGITKASQTSLNFQAIEDAAGDLADGGDFRTKDVARHPIVQAGHPDVRDDPQFSQHIGMYLAEAVGRLRIEQVSPKGQSNATWRRRT